MSKQKKNNWWIIAVVAVLLVGGGFGYYKLGMEPAAQAASAAATDAAPQTEVVRRGSLEVTASGSGTLVPADEKDLSFSSDGTVGGVYVSVGEQVEAGTLLAELEDLGQLEANVASAKVDLLTAERALEELYENADVTLADAYAAYVEAKDAYEDAEIEVKRKDYARCSQDVNTLYLEEYQKWLDKVEELEERVPGSDELVEAESQLATAKANYEYCIEYTDQEILESEADYEVAKANYDLAKAEYEALQVASGVDPDDVLLAETSVTSAELDLAIAEDILEGATLESPFDGMIVSISGDVGESVEETDTFITIANLDGLFVDVNMDETDMDKFAVGYPVSVVFDALPEKTFTGVVVEVEPEIKSSGQYSVVQGTVELDASSVEVGQTLPLGLAASVEVVAGSVEKALLVPVEALHQLEDGSYVVYVMDSGSPEMREVEIGLMDYTYAEIKSGLKQGETVATGDVELN